jgi:alcohol dehydrogenase
MTVPSTMRAMLLTGHGGPEVLHYRTDVPVPVPGPGEVLVRVGACGVNNTDIWVREGAYGRSDDPEAVASFSDNPLQFPMIQGADIAGTIATVGADVDAGRIGERVMVDFGIYADDDMDTPSHDYIGSARPGGYADYVAVPTENAHSIETSLTDAELATFCCAYVTGEHMLNRARVRLGERVLITGASGGVGSGVVQLCRARAAVPYAVASAEKVEAVDAVGAQATVARDTPDLPAAVAEALGGKTVDVIVDTVAGPLLPDLLEILPPHGRYVCCGAIGGAMVEVDMRRIYLKHLDILGASQGSRRDFARVRDYVTSGTIRPLLAGTYPLRDLARAQADFKKKDFVGKLVIDVGAESG